MAQASAPTVSVATLRELVQEATQRYPELATKLERATNLVVLRRIERASSSGSWWVQSEADPTNEYLVHEAPGGQWVCLCQDYIRRGGPCKHALAIRLLVAAERTEQRRGGQRGHQSTRLLVCRAEGHGLRQKPSRVLSLCAVRPHVVRGAGGRAA